MKPVVKILSVLFVLTFLSYAQSDNTINLYNNDSLKIRINSTPLTEIQIKFEEFELHREFYDLRRKISLDGDPQTVWLRTSLAVSNTIDPNNQKSLHYLSPFYAQYLEDSKFNPVRYVLGMAQIGAVGYLAYKHIKKYGFFK